MLFRVDDGKFEDDRYYWTKWGLQQGMNKYRNDFRFILYSGHINWKEKLNEVKEKA